MVLVTNNNLLLLLPTRCDKLRLLSMKFGL